MHATLPRPRTRPTPRPARAAAEALAGVAAGAPEGAALPPLTRGELFQRAIRQNALGAVFDENAKVRVPGRCGCVVWCASAVFSSRFDGSTDVLPRTGARHQTPRRHPTSPSQEGPRLIGVLCPVAAMMNHDCDANSVANGVWDAGKAAVVMRVSTIRDVEEGACAQRCMWVAGHTLLFYDGAVLCCRV